MRYTIDRFMSLLRTITSPASDNELFERLLRSVASGVVDGLGATHTKRSSAK